MALPTRDCPFCAKSFAPTRPWQVYCSTRCQQGFHQGRSKNALFQAAQVEALKEELDALRREHADLQRDHERALRRLEELGERAVPRASDPNPFSLENLRKIVDGEEG